MQMLPAIYQDSGEFIFKQDCRSTGHASFLTIIFHKVV